MTVYDEINNMREMGLIIQSTRELLEQTIKKKYPLHHCTHCSENLGRRPKKIKVKANSRTTIQDENMHTSLNRLVK